MQICINLLNALFISKIFLLIDKLLRRVEYTVTYLLHMTFYQAIYLNFSVECFPYFSCAAIL